MCVLVPHLAYKSLKLLGDGYLNGKLIPTMLHLRLERENFWIKTLRSVYLYGLLTLSVPMSAYADMTIFDFLADADILNLYSYLPDFISH